LIKFIAILADTVTSTPATKTPPPPGWYQFIFSPTTPLIIVFAVVWIYVFRKKGGGDKEMANRLKDLKRGDRIKTIGGILGTVVEARENEVVIKVDETNNTKIKFSRTAIAQVIDEEKPAAK
jgi:preprotein translocase subunit YajC